MPVSENGSTSGGDSVLAVLGRAYADTPVGDVEGSVEPTGATESAVQHVETTEAGQATPESSAPVASPETVDGTPEAVASEADKPFRVFRNEDEYRQHLDEYVKRERGAQSALQTENKSLQDKFLALEAEKTALERWRNEIYTRSQSEELTPQELVQSFIRQQGETNAEFEARKASAAEALATEARQTSDRELVTALSRNADRTALLEQARPLEREFGNVPGLDIPTALEKAIEGSTEAQWYARLSHSAMTVDDQGRTVPDFETRRYAAGKAYALGESSVRAAVTTLKAQLAEQATTLTAAAVAPATSLPGTAGAGYDGSRFKTSVAAFTEAYSSR